MKPLPRVALVLGSTVMALLASEAGLRLFAPELRSARSQRPITGWSSDEYQRFDPKADQNSRGTRILVLGDSFLTKPAEPEPDNRFPTLLQARLGPRATIRTLASEGWGTDQELLAFMEKGRSWAPDVVVLAFCANNDISNNFSHDHGLGQLKPYFELESNRRLTLHDGLGAPLDYESLFERPAVRCRLLDLLRRGLQTDAPVGPVDDQSYPAVDPRYKRFRFWEEHPEEIYFRQHALSWSPQAGVNHVSAYIHEDFEANTYQWQLLEALLAKLKSEVESAGARLVVLLLPVIFNPQDAETIAGGSFNMSFETPDGAFTFRSLEPGERLAAISARLGVACIDPTPEFIREVVEHDLMPAVWPDPRDRHFSHVGHELLADYLEQHMGLLAGGR